jgi:Cof subfamily protein (haloacid dehalogenase superfamily)
MIRLLATDLDGTLVRSDNTVSEASRASLSTAHDAGFGIVLVTGRPTRWLWEIADMIGYTGIAVTANGALTFDLETHTVIDSFPLTAEQLINTTEALRQEFPQVYFGVESGDTFAHEPGYAHDWQINPARDRDGQLSAAPEVADLQDILQRPALKLLARIHDGQPDAFLARATELLGDAVYVTHSARSALLEISAAGVTKASGLRRYCHRLGIDQSEVSAVGDMPNDVPMLSWAGQSFAVANAHPAAQHAAGEVLAESNDEDAVALLIDRLLLGYGSAVTSG